MSYLHYMLTCYQSELGRHDSKALLAAAINPICEPTVNNKKIVKIHHRGNVSYNLCEQYSLGPFTLPLIQ